MPQENGWFRCQVTEAGAADIGTIVHLKEIGGVFPSRQFLAHQAKTREILAVALMAMTTGHLVDAYLVSTNENSQINALIAVKP